MLTVPEAAGRVNRNPETVRRWIRSGRLRAQKIGTQHVIDERDLEAFASSDRSNLPEELLRFESGAVQPNWVELIHRSRQGR